MFEIQDIKRENVTHKSYIRRSNDTIREDCYICKMMQILSYKLVPIVFRDLSVYYPEQKTLPDNQTVKFVEYLLGSSTSQWLKETIRREREYL